ncbi:tryptophan synthase subunit alpha [Olivibacter sp. SDN3]|uniref:tryptophan synthase subunit alpha n=1 Tax=Olivibacter sp. SDN3 TaxID=2764720 RepID=UPI0016515809|nr:tryptophan synthase subunit alpha [Olivibacter sp. SDN3]QNL48927.1 tryptophan synthase subunit alpha [Olivibacter sp. SDN3]
MNRINELFESKGKKKLLSIYYTAGYPGLDDTIELAKTLQASGVDFLEIGFPYSDPVADGPVIQHSSEQALKNGMSLECLFNQLKTLRQQVSIPVLLMGYVNPMLQYGVERFCRACAEVGVDGVIVPDLPVYEYEEHYHDIFKKYNVSNIFLITPQTSEERVRKIDALSTGFIYMVSSSSTTGKNLAVSESSQAYFDRIKKLNLRNPLTIGFGISDHESFEHALTYADAAIVGSAFVKLLQEPDFFDKIPGFVEKIKGEVTV